MNSKRTDKKIFLCSMCLVSLIFAGCNNLSTIFSDEIQDIAEPVSIDTNVVTANTQFGFDLFNEIRKIEQDKNIFISPLSISIALAMTLNGASGETEQAMANTL